jgi:hypothetical protein
VRLANPLAATSLAAASLAAATQLAAQDQARYHPFQQEVSYRIEAIQDEATHVLTGRARLRYVNRAPEALTRLYFHQYLNAFRPHSEWARYDLRFDDRTFQDLGPAEHGFERISDFRVEGRRLAPMYPFAPDSTVFYVELPIPLAPGDSLVAVMDWTARLATEPRRQGRLGRHYNWAHWYPRIAVYGRDGWEYRPHIRPGELNGEFGRYDVTLDLPADQILGATGVPVEGDPGWAGAAVPGSEPPAHRRDHYGDRPPEPLGLLDTVRPESSRPSAASAPSAPSAASAASASSASSASSAASASSASSASSPAPAAPPARKRVRWRAEDVHNFAWSTSPDYRYRGSHWNGTAIHLLWEPTSPGWDPERVMRQQKEALDWLAAVFGEYAWPQITVTDRIERGATEFPMLYMTSGGAVVHETMHMVAHGILANNEWRDGWLDEGLASFLSNWSREAQGDDPERVWARTRDLVATLDARGLSEPVGLPAAEFSSYDMYQVMTYTKGSLIFRMLRDVLGEDTFRAGLWEYYQRFRFRQVTARDFQNVMEAVSGQDLEWFFRQWLHTIDVLDFRVGDVRLTGQPGGYTLVAEVVREGRGWMPLVVEAGGQRQRLESRQRVQQVTFHLEEPAETVVLDPDGILPLVRRAR